MPIVARCSKDRFLTVYRPFFTVFSVEPIRESLDESSTAPFSQRVARLENEENRGGDWEAGEPPLFSRYFNGHRLVTTADQQAVGQEAERAGDAHGGGHGRDRAVEGLADDSA